MAAPVVLEERATWTREERALAQRLRTPYAVQRFLTAFPYNPDDSLRSFRGVVRAGRANCVEGALLAAAVLETHGHAPLLLDLESQDRVDHVLYVFREDGRFGSVGLSQYPGLHGRKPVYPTVRQLALSYYDPYVDETGRLESYALFDLRDAPGVDWRLGDGDLWDLHERLCAAEHKAIPSSDARYRVLRSRYRSYKRRVGREPTYYRTAPNWLA